MEIIYSPTLISSLKNKHLLLDTNVFRDMASKPTIFADFFNLLKKEGVTLATLDVVKYEILKGSRDNEKYKEKEKQIDAIIDIVLPVIPSEDNRNTKIVSFKQVISLIRFLELPKHHNY